MIKPAGERLTMQEKGFDPKGTKSESGVLPQNNLSNQIKHSVLQGVQEVLGRGCDTDTTCSSAPQKIESSQPAENCVV